MADNKVFMGPNYNSIIEQGSDRQFITVPIENTEFGSRKSITSKISGPNDAAELVHVTQGK